VRDRWSAPAAGGEKPETFSRRKKERRKEGRRKEGPDLQADKAAKGAIGAFEQARKDLRVGCYPCASSSEVRVSFLFRRVQVLLFFSFLFNPRLFGWGWTRERPQETVIGEGKGESHAACQSRCS